MGEGAALSAGLAPMVLGKPPGEVTTAADTRRAAAALVAHGVDLLLFAGGDGTARDIAAVGGTSVPILGIPTGVKMHSGVFATGPEAAGQLAEPVAGISRLVRLREAEVMDVDEAALRAGRVSARLYGYARVPHSRATWCRVPRRAGSSRTRRRSTAPAARSRANRAGACSTSSGRARRRSACSGAGAGGHAAGRRRGAGRAAGGRRSREAECWGCWPMAPAPIVSGSRAGRASSSAAATSRSAPR